MYDSSLEFDSEEFDLLTLDFADIKQLRSAHVLNVRIRGGKTANADGSIPEQDDFRVIFGIGYDF